jgi:DNA-binding cell septation regulator SpoVG
VDLDSTIIYDKFGEIAAESNVFMTTTDKKTQRKSIKQDIYHPVPAAFLSELNNPEYSSKKQKNFSYLPH